MILPLLQNGRVLLRGRMFPHVDVHSRANKHWRLASQVEGTEHVRSEAMGEIGHGVCRGWGYKQKIRPLGQLDVRGNPVRLFILKGGKDRVAEIVCRVRGVTNSRALAVQTQCTS